MRKLLNSFFEMSTIKPKFREQNRIECQFQGKHFEFEDLGLPLGQSKEFHSIHGTYEPSKRISGSVEWEAPQVNS